jgi:hypothetical protein
MKEKLHEWGTDNLPEYVAEVLQDMRVNYQDYGLSQAELNGAIEEAEKFAAQRHISAQYDNLDWFQVKASSGGPEVDVFIDIVDWNDLSPSDRDTIEEVLTTLFNVTQDPEFVVDFYQNINPEAWKVALYTADPWEYIDPATRLPPGSVSLLSDGTIVHDLLHK